MIPVDASTPLTASAQSAGALYNSEADYVDSSGTTHQLPLELLNPDKGIGIQTSLKVPVGNIGAALSATAARPARPRPARRTTGGTTAVGYDGTSPVRWHDRHDGVDDRHDAPRPRRRTTEFAINVNGTTDLVPFNLWGTPASGILLSSHARAYDLSQVGGISGQLTLTNLTGTSSTSGLPAIQATAEVLSADGTRHVAVASAPVDSDGNFLLYPLDSQLIEPPSTTTS